MLMICSNLGYALHPRITSNLKPGARVADIACGTGRWFVQLAPVLPEGSTMHGFDVSDAQFPKKDTKPANMTFAEHNALEPFPAELHGTFDAVHVRLLVAALHDSAMWDSVMCNALALLKPGGAIQWDEHDLLSKRAVRGPDPASSAQAQIRSTQLSNQMMGERLKLAYDGLLARMNKFGLESVFKDQVSTDRVPKWRANLSTVTLGAEYRITRNGAASGKLDMTVEEVDSMNEEALREIEAGAYKTYNIGVFVGWKP